MINYIWVRGVSFRQVEVRQCAVGDPVEFVREPENPHDSGAIKVVVHSGQESLHVGYIPKELCSRLDPLLPVDNAVVSELYERDSGVIGVQISFEHSVLLPRQATLRVDENSN